MSPLIKLIKAYNSNGYEISTGLNPYLFDNARQAPFTWLIRNGNSVTEGLGIGLQEILFLDELSKAVKPKTIFIVGNSFGWSAVALALSNLQAKTIAIDAGFDQNSREGVDLTNRLASQLGLNLKALLATSPQDVGGIVSDHLTGVVDLALIDGLHTSEQVSKDVEVLKPFLSPNAVVVFHDVLLFGLAQGMTKIEQSFGIAPRIMWATPSGMAVLSKSDIPEVSDILDVFAGSEAGRNVLREKIKWDNEQRKWRRLKKIGRSLRKRLGQDSERPKFLHAGRISNGG